MTAAKATAAPTTTASSSDAALPPPLAALAASGSDNAPAASARPRTVSRLPADLPRPVANWLSPSSTSVPEIRPETPAIVQHRRGLRERAFLRTTGIVVAEGWSRPSSARTTGKCRWKDVLFRGVTCGLGH
jgi:hypothetical protein